VSPVDALGLLVEMLSIAGTRQHGVKSIEQYPEDSTGEGTISVLKNAYEVLSRISGKDSGSLGLHPAVYFYNEKGKYSRFLFLAVVSIIQEKLKNNNSEWFKQFTSARASLENFLLDNKSVIGMLIVNLSKGQRVSKMKDLIELLVSEFKTPGTEVTIEQAIASLGLSGRIVDVRSITKSPVISDDTKAAVYLRDALPKALHCPICNGLMEPKKSVTYDHILRVRDEGSGDMDNVQMAHPYCNSGYKN
jgi:hypothetical protein